MNIIPSIITVKCDESLERAIAADVGNMDENDLTESFLNQMSVEYRPDHYNGNRKVVVEDPSNEGQDDIEKDKKSPAND